MKINLRKAAKYDMPTVYQLMQDLKIALNEDGLNFTVEDLERDGGFDGNLSYFFTLLAEDLESKDSNGLPNVVGFAMRSYVHTWDGRTIYLRNFFVNESHRSKGVGKLIFEGLLKHAKEIGCNRIEVHVSDRNERARKFYEKMGASDKSGRDGYILYRFYQDFINKIVA